MLSNTFAELDTKTRTLRRKTSRKLSTIFRMNSITTNPYDLYAARAKEFRKAYQLPSGLTPTTLALQQNLIAEEFVEVCEATFELDGDVTNKRARENLLKELCDLVYVCHQMAAAFNWDLTTAYMRVHESNMSKLDENGQPIRREDGKILKGPRYFTPSLIDLV